MKYAIAEADKAVLRFHKLKKGDTVVTVKSLIEVAELAKFGYVVPLPNGEIMSHPITEGTKARAELSSQLAKAIGWPDNWIWKTHIDCYVNDLEDDEAPRHTWKALRFDDPAVIWPIAERFNCWPTGLQQINRYAAMWGRHYGTAHYSWGKTPEEAVTLATIERIKRFGLEKALSIQWG